MSQEKLKLWSGSALIGLLCITFFTYCLIAAPCEPNDIGVKLENKPVLADTNSQVQIERQFDDSKTKNTNVISHDFYLCEITSFYERVITILSIMIFVILGLIFFFSIKISRNQAEEEAYKAVSSEYFSDKVSRIVKDNFIELKNEGEIPDILSGLQDLGDRIKFLEDQVNIQGYANKENDDTGENV